MRKLKFVLVSALAAAVLLLSSTVFATDLFGSNPEVKKDTQTNVEIKKDKLNVKPGTMVSNFFSFGTSLSGLDKEETVKVIGETRENILSQKLHATSADEDKEWEATLKELGVTLQSEDISEALSDALLEGSLLTRYKKAKAYEKNPVNLISGMVIDEESILAQIKEALNDWNQEVQESYAHFNGSALEITEGQYGHEYDFTPGVEKFIEALKKGTLEDESFELECEYTTTEPTLTPEMVRGFTVIGSCTTSYAPPTDESLKAREINLAKGIGNANGRVYAPGEIVSMLEIYGDVSVANGYGIAGTYNQAGHTEEVGGGLCQVASTMYNAALMAELKIVHRENHRFMVAYLPPSLDAMIYARSGNDFKFENSSSDYIIIDSYINRSAHTITINIIGHEDHSPDRKVSYYSEIISDIIMPQSENKVNPNMSIGANGDTFKTSEHWFLTPEFTSQSYKVVTEGGKTTVTPLTRDHYQKSAQGYIEVPADKYVVTTALEGYAGAKSQMHVGTKTNNGYAASFIMMDAQYVGEDGNSGSGYAVAGATNYTAINEVVPLGMAARGYHGWTATGAQKQGATKALEGAPEESSSEEESSIEDSSESSSEPAGEPASEPAGEPSSEPEGEPSGEIVE